MKISPRSQISNHKSRRFEKKYYSNISVLFVHIKRIHDRQGRLVGRTDTFARPLPYDLSKRRIFKVIYNYRREAKRKNNRILLFSKNGRPIGRNDNKIFIGHAFASIDWFQQVVPVVRSINRSPFDVFFSNDFRVSVNTAVGRNRAPRGREEYSIYTIYTCWDFAAREVIRLIRIFVFANRNWNNPKLLAIKNRVGRESNSKFIILVE